MTANHIARRLAPLWLPGLMVVITATYVIGINNPLVYDDMVVIQDNAFIQDSRWASEFLKMETTSSAGFKHFRPLTMWTLSLNYRIGGTDVWTYRAVNLGLHLVCTLLVFVLLRRLLTRLPLAGASCLTPQEATVAALVAATLFGLHPIHSLSVLLVWKRTTLLAAIFFLAAVLALLKVQEIGRSPERARISQALGTAAIPLGFVLALAAKEIAITLPAILLLFDLWLGGTSRSRRQWIRFSLLHCSLWAIACVFLLLFFPTALREGTPTSSWAYLLTQCKVFWFYLMLIVVPQKLSIAYDIALADAITEPGVALACVAVLGLVALAAVMHKRSPLLTVMILWLFITFSPTTSVVPGPLLVDEDRTYLPLIAVWALAGVGFSRAFFHLHRGNIIATIVLAAAVVGMMAGTVSRCVTWSDEVWIWHDAIRKYPASNVAQTGWCSVLSRSRGHAAEALSVCREAREREPTNALAWAGLVSALIFTGDLERAREELERGLNISPHDRHLNRLAGHFAWMTDRPKRAVFHYRNVLRQSPLDLQATLYLAICYKELGQLAAARQEARRLEGRPIHSSRDAEALAELYLDLKLTRRARSLWNRLRRSDPLSIRPLLGLARIAMSRGDSTRADSLLQQARQMAKNDPALLMHLAEAYSKMNRTRMAQQLLERIVSMRPHEINAKLALAVAMLKRGDREGACRIFLRLKRSPIVSKKDWETVRHACASRR